MLAYKQIYTTHKELIQNFFWRSLQIFGKQGVVFLIFIYCAKLLSPYDFGTYNYVMAIIFFLIMFGDFGISTATSKYVAEYNATEPEKLKAVLFNSGLIIFLITILITLLTLFFGHWYLKENYTYIFYLLPLVFLAPLSSLYDGIYRGLKKFKQLAIISLITGLSSLSFVYFLVKYKGITGAFISQDIFYLLLVIGSAFFYKELHLKIHKSVIKEIGAYSIAFGIATMGYYFFSRVDILILGHYGYIKEIGTYELLNKIFTIVLVPFTILGQIIAPDFTILFAKKDYLKLKNEYRKYLKFILIGSLVISLILFLVSPIIIHNFLPKYNNSIFSSIFLLVVLIYALNYFNSPINAGIIVATGYARLMTYMNIYLGILNFVSCIVFVKLFGYIGVIYGTLLSSIVGTIVLQWRYYLKLKAL